MQIRIMKNYDVKVLNEIHSQVARVLFCDIIVKEKREYVQN